jgi:hypothetical protein
MLACIIDVFLNCKQDLLFSMAEQHKLKHENMNNRYKIITIKRELDKASQEKMRLSQIYYGNLNRIVVTAATA